MRDYLHRWVLDHLGQVRERRTERAERDVRDPAAPASREYLGVVAVEETERILNTDHLGGIDRCADFTEVGVLNAHAGEPLSQVELSRRTGIDSADVVGLLRGLESRAMLVRSSDPEDRRRNVVPITGAGTRELRHLDIVVGAARAGPAARTARRKGADHPHRAPPPSPPSSQPLQPGHLRLRPPNAWRRDRRTLCVTGVI